MSEQLLLSVVIPIKNAGYWIVDLLDALFRQTLAGQMEVILIDSGSSDGTLDIVKKYPVRLIEIDPATFNHGSTRNLGVTAAKGKYVVMTVQDAQPATTDWLELLLNGFDDEKVAGVCGQQVVPHDAGKNPVQWFRPVHAPGIKKYVFDTAEDFDMLSPAIKVQVCGWDDVTACYRRDVLLKVPFREVSFSEDAVWAADVLKKGYSIVYNTAARVFHYHNEPPGFAFSRTLTVLYFRYRFFGYIPATVKPGWKKKGQIIKLLLKEKISLPEKFKWWTYNMAIYKARYTAFKIFTKALAEGEQTLDTVHAQYCGQAPQATNNIQ